MLVNKKVLSEEEVWCGVDKLKEVIVDHYIRTDDEKQCYNIFGIPKNGAIVAGMLCGRSNKLIQTLTPESADFIVDDIVDSGETIENYAEAYNLPCFALYGKRKYMHDIYDCSKLDLEVIENVHDDLWIEFPWEEDQAGPEDGVIRLLEYFGQDVNREGLKDTPERVVKSFAEFLKGYDDKPEEILKTTFSSTYDELAVLKDIKFISMCEHHLLPIVGTASIGYLPQNGKVVGISKLARIVDCYSRRLQIQERMTMQIANAIQKYVDPSGVAVFVEASHSCIACRGAKQPESKMVTSCMLGKFRKSGKMRNEFLQMIK